MISEKLSAVYARLEDSFYGIMDFLDAKGLPVYKVIDFVENRGIPFFPLCIALIVLLAGLVVGLMLVSSSLNPVLNVSIQDELGNGVNGVSVSIEAEGK